MVVGIGLNCFVDLGVAYIKLVVFVDLIAVCLLGSFYALFRDVLLCYAALMWFCGSVVVYALRVGVLSCVLLLERGFVYGFGCVMGFRI